VSRSALASLTRLLAAGAAVVAVSATVLACAPTEDPTTAPTASATASAPASSPTSEPAPVELQPAADAQANLPFFTATADAVWNSADQTSGRAYIDALVAAGFDKTAMQVTRDTTTVGDASESIQFSVLWTGDQCLIGQAGPATGALVTGVFPAVSQGRCLLGDTRPIDW
jgi:hypothetical protein